MKQECKENPPDSADLEGWRRAVTEGRLASFRLEALVAAIQDLGPGTDQVVRNALAKHLSDAVMKMLRPRVSRRHPNEGEDIIYRVHGDIFSAVAQKDSKDGLALREAFAPRVAFRIRDAVAAEYRDSVIPDVPGGTAGVTKLSDAASSPAETDAAAGASDLATAAPTHAGGRRSRSSDTDLLSNDGLETLDQQIDVSKALRRIRDPRKRQAFRLAMDGLPFASIRSESIAKAVGVSNKTAKKWIEEARRLLEAAVEVKELQQQDVGER